MVTVVAWSIPSAHAAFAPFLGAVFGLGLLPLDFALALAPAADFAAALGVASFLGRRLVDS